ncbi:MAG: hypothetical protein WEF86_13330 [Gemmatimonadota bacterium]
MYRLKRWAPLMALVFGACDDGFGPGSWIAAPDTVVLYSASRAEYLGLGSALDIVRQPVGAVKIETAGQTGNWDAALIEVDGALWLAPAASFEGLASRARIAVLANVSWDELEQAPRDTTLYTAEPVLVQANTVYVVRSRRASCGLSQGYRYAKLDPIEVDVDAGTFSFEVIRNPYCDDRSFVPPED